MKTVKKGLRVLAEDGFREFISQSSRYVLKNTFLLGKLNRKTISAKKRELPQPILSKLVEWEGHGSYFKPNGIHYVPNTKTNLPQIDSQLTPLTEYETCPETIYACGNDVINIESKNDRRQVFLGVGNVSSLDAVSHLDPNVLFFVDPNVSQLSHLKLIFKIMEQSNSRAEFISTFFGKKKSDVIETLESLSSTNIGSPEIEAEFWQSQDAKEPASDLHEKLLDYEYITMNGKIIAIRPEKYGSDVIGDNLILPTLQYRSENNIEKLNRSHHLYPLYQKDGFLSSEERFKQTKTILESRAIASIPQPLNADLLHYISEQYRYYEIHLWCSNILREYFWTPTQTQLVNKIEYLRHFDEGHHNIQVWDDDRTAFFGNEYTNLRGPHWDAFSVVNEHIYGDTAEVVPIEKWLDEESTLPNTEKIPPNDLFNEPIQWNTIFFHIMIGHGESMDAFKQQVDVALDSADRVVILEHNAESSDFNGNKGASKGELIDLIGDPHTVEFTAGKTDNKRNIVMVYDGRV